MSSRSAQLLLVVVALLSSSPGGVDSAVTNGLIPIGTSDAWVQANEACLNPIGEWQRLLDLWLEISKSYNSVDARIKELEKKETDVQRIERQVAIILDEANRTFFNEISELLKTKRSEQKSIESKPFNLLTKRLSSMRKVTEATTTNNPIDDADAAMRKRNDSIISAIVTNQKKVQSMRETMEVKQDLEKVTEDDAVTLRTQNNGNLTKTAQDLTKKMAEFLPDFAELKILRKERDFWLDKLNLVYHISDKETFTSVHNTLSWFEKAAIHELHRSSVDSGDEIPLDSCFLSFFKQIEVISRILHTEVMRSKFNCKNLLVQRLNAIKDVMTGIDNGTTKTWSNISRLQKSIQEGSNNKEMEFALGKELATFQAAGGVPDDGFTVWWNGQPRCTKDPSLRATFNRTLTGLRL